MTQPVAIKSVEQQDIQCLHRIRSQAVAHRTALANQIRGLLHEYGIQVPQGRAWVRRQMPQILEDAENGLTHRFRQLLSDLYEELAHMDDRVEKYDEQISILARESASAQRLMAIPGIGPLSATALIAAVGDASMFRNGREMSAWLGLVPRQCSTGGKSKLLGISKRGDVYLRQFLIHGARSALRVIEKRQVRRTQWAKTYWAEEAQTSSPLPWPTRWQEPPTRCCDTMMFTVQLYLRERPATRVA